MKKLVGFWGGDSDELRKRVYEIRGEENIEKIISHGERCTSLALKIFLERKGFNAEERLPENIGLTLNMEEQIDLSVSLKDSFNEEKIYIVPGFYAMYNGEVKTLGRGGSDYTATALAYMLDVKEVILYKDVSSLFSCDPKMVKNSVPITKISYEIAEILSYFGAKIIHSQAILPAKLKNIPVRITGIKGGKYTLISKELDFGVFSMSFLENEVLISGTIEKIPRNVKYLDVFQNKANVVVEREKIEEIKSYFSEFSVVEDLSLLVIGGDIDIGKNY